VRIEDLDAARVVPGGADRLLRTLEQHGLEWDGPIEYQSRRTTHYQAALERLTRAGLTFECSCSRRDLVDEAGYPGTCRAAARRAGPTATRFRVGIGTVSFTDRVQGECHFALPERGDVIVRRRDAVIAYQLAVVVDDALQNVTDVVRGADLLDNTPWQIALQRALALPVPRYAHLPLVTEPGGAKLAKSKRSMAIDPDLAAVQLHCALSLLGQAPPATLKSEPPPVILAWARANWSLEPLRCRGEVLAPPPPP